MAQSGEDRHAPLIMLRRRNPRPASPADDLARKAAFPKPQHLQPAEPADTRSLPLRKIHPNRDEGYRRWLRFKPCAVEGLTDQKTDQLHICWSPDMIGRRFLSDPAHGGKAYSGRLKRDDSGCFPLCRLGHRAQEDSMDDFDRRFGIDRHEIAARYWVEYQKEKERTS